jgi:hypothetical protein
MITEALNEYAASLDKEREKDRGSTVGASEIGKCARQVYYTKNFGDPVYGAPMDPWYEDDWGYRLRGTIMEEQFWVPAMRARYGDDLLFAGKEQKTLVDVYLSSTTDGLLRLDDGYEVQDCKSLDPRVVIVPKPEHVYQVKVNIGAFRALTPYKPDRARLTYIDASCWSTVREFIIPHDPGLYEHAKERATKIMEARKASDLKPEGWIAGGRECEFCPFTKACGMVRANVPKQEEKELKPEFVASVCDLAIKAKRLGAEEKKVKTDKRALEEQIRELMRVEHVNKVPGIVTWSPIKATPRYNIKAALEDGVDLEPYRSEGEPGDRLTITLKDELVSPKKAKTRLATAS